MSLYGCNVFPFAWVGDFVHVQQPYAVQDGILRHFETETPSSHARSSHKKTAAELRIKKALRCGAEATVFFVLCCAIYAVGQMKHQPDGALQCVSFVTYVVLYFYGLNILRNLKRIFKKASAPWQIVAFLYYILRFKFIERIPDLAEYLNFTDQTDTPTNVPSA